jgi:membrane associated rhomboid family serine protease
MLSITLIIIIVTVLISVSGFSREKIIDDLIFYPPAISSRKQYYRFITNGFIHADIGHLAFNMLSLYLFGQFVEEKFTEIFGDLGRILYLVMYIIAIAVCLLPTYLKHKHNYSYRSLGASGAVSAVMFAGLLIAPDVRVSLFFIPIGIPGFIFGPLYLIITAYLDKRGGGNINHSAHLWGAVFGLAFVIVLGYAIAGYDAIGEFVRGVSSYINS